MAEQKFAVTEHKFEYKGRECIVVFTKLGFRNGYVSVKQPFDYEKLINIDAHGGLNFSGELPDYYGATREYYIGFDCGHCWDGIDMDQAIAYGLQKADVKDYWLTTDEPVRSVEYVSEECKKIVDQLEDNKYGI